MSATFQTVTLGGREYEVYADIASADIHMEADASTNGAVWRAAEDDDKGRALVTATRIFDRLRWAGEVEVEGQDHAFPRTNSDGLVPQQIVDGSIELAAAILGGFDALNVQSTAQKEKRVKAGSVEVEYFRGAEGKATRLPLPVYELVRDWLANSLGVSGSTAYGTCGDSITDRDFGVSRGI